MATSNMVWSPSSISSPYKQLSGKFDLKRPRIGGALTLALCAGGICVCYLYYGILQEQIFSNTHIDATFVLVSQTWCNTFVAVIWRKISASLQTKDDAMKQPREQQQGRLNHLLLIMTAFCYFVAMTASNECLHYVSYPTAVLAKSCKLIPTMIMGWIVEKRAYDRREWIGAACITFGIVLFNLSRIQHHDEGKGDSLYGLALLAMSLFMDGMLGACQGLLKRKEYSNSNGKLYRPPTAIETMLYVNLYALAFLLPMAIVTGQWSHGMLVLRQEGWEGLGRGMVLLNAAASVGQIFIFMTIHLYSPLCTTTITTTRKFFTILLSVLRFGHVFTTVQWCCVALVFGGLYMGIVSKTVLEEKQDSSTPRKKVE